MLEKSEKILAACKQETSTNPLEIFMHISTMDFVAVHGPEHHVLIGASLITAYKNAGGNVNLDATLQKMAQEGERMPVAMCGLWANCGAAPSIGAALSILEKTGYLNPADQHMETTATALYKIGKLGTPRCCKRAGYISLLEAGKYLNQQGNVQLDVSMKECPFSAPTARCLQEACPFFPKEK